MMRIQTLLTLVLLTGPALAAADFKVIVHPDVPVKSLPARQVSALFLRDITKWSDGTKALPVDAVPGSPLRESFSREVHGRSAMAIKNYWLQQIFSGRGVPPPEKPGDNEVIAYVRANRGAIGYVSASHSTEGVKVLEIVQ